MSGAPAGSSDTPDPLGRPPFPSVAPPVPVLVPHVPGKLRTEVVEAIYTDGYPVTLVPTPEDDPYAYATALRAAWRAGDGFFIVEQASRPPEGGVASQQRCPAAVCSRPHDCRRPGMLGTFACFRVSAALTRSAPDLADRLYGRRDTEVWWRRGMLVNRPWRPGAARPAGLSTACLDPAAVAELGPFPGPLWPTTQPWNGADSELHYELARRGVAVHWHRRPSVHLPAGLEANPTPPER